MPSADTGRTSTSATQAVRPGAAGPGGLLARAGAWSASHLRVVLVAWLVVLAGFGFFAPRATSALAGAGWQDSGSQSVAARRLIRKDFSGVGSSAMEVVVRDSRRRLAADPTAGRVMAQVTHLLRGEPDVSTVIPPRPGVSLSRDGRTAVIIAGAAAGTNTMVKTAGTLAGPLGRLGRDGITVTLTGDSALWADFNTANHSAMMRSEMLSWPVTMVILLIAFGSVIAAGLPLMLTLAGLLIAAGALVLANHLAPVSIWALNFALMFALALGIDYALFLVVRFRAALDRRDAAAGDRGAAVAAVAETMATAGKAVAISAVTVMASLAAILLVPSPAFRSMSLGIMLAVAAVLAATLTLLPAVLGSLGTRVNSGRLRLGRSGPVRPAGHRLEQRLHMWGRTLWRHPLITAGGAVAVLAVAAAPAFGLRTAMPSIAIIPATANARIGYQQVAGAFGPGAPGSLQIVVPAAREAAALHVLHHAAGIAGATAGPVHAGWALDQAVPTSGPSTAATGATISRLRRDLPAGSMVGGAAAENYDLQQALASKTPLVFGVLAGMGFLLLLLALGAPVIAAAGVAVTGLSVAGAFGVARLIFQDGYLSGLLGFQPQGFIDAWGPLFFGAMVFGVAMDYTLFLLSAAKERYDSDTDPQRAMIGSVGTSGRVIVSAAAVMVAVFLTFALSGPLAPKEMGVILAVAVALDAVLGRLILLPVVLRAGQHRAWHRPAWLARILPGIRFSH